MKKGKESVWHACNYSLSLPKDYFWFNFIESEIARRDYPWGREEESMGLETVTHMPDAK